MRVFKQEQMYMVEEYFQLKLKSSKQEMMLMKQNRVIKD